MEGAAGGALSPLPVLRRHPFTLVALPGAGAERLERADDLGVELCARAAADLVRGRLDRPRLLVRALMHENVEHVRDVDETALQRDVVAGQPLRVPGPVPALVVRTHGALGRAQE